MSRGTLARLSLSARDRRALDETLADWPNADSGCIPGETATVEDLKGHGEELFFIPFIPFMVRALDHNQPSKPMISSMGLHDLHGGFLNTRCSLRPPIQRLHSWRKRYREGHEGP